MSRPFRLRLPCSAVLLVMCGAACGCSYSAGESSPAVSPGGYQSGSLYRSGIGSVAISIFETRDYQRDAEFQLSRALAQEVELRTPYKVVPAERADTLLEGEILAIRSNRLSDDRDSAVPQEQLLIYTVNFTWKDLRSGKILVDRRNFEQASAYFPTLGEGRFTGTQQAAEALAVAIVQELQADW